MKRIGSQALGAYGSVHSLELLGFDDSECPSWPMTLQQSPEKLLFGGGKSGGLIEQWNLPVARQVHVKARRDVLRNKV